METPGKVSITWTAYLRHRAGLRGFELEKLEEIIRYSAERYFDLATRRSIVVGKHDRLLVMIPYERRGREIVPVTIHPTTRQQINFRLKTRRFIHEQDENDIF